MSGLTWNLVWALAAYVGIVRLLRYRRRDGLARKYGYLTRPSYASMTLGDAFAIQRPLAELEFPRIFSASVFFALFKTYGIPSISRLLVATGQLSSEITSSKRAADTGVIITEVVLNNPSSQRAIDGIARMNFLHGRYRKAGKISDDDMLYTLSLFALEPIRWTSLYEWRALSEVELCAMGVYWKDLGEAMEIPFDAIKPHLDEFDDGLSWLRAIEAWGLEYEKEHMVPDPVNKKLSLATIDIALFNVPKCLRGLVLKLISALLDPRLRKAMMLEEPDSFHEKLLHAVLSIRKYILRYLCLPRPSFLRVRWFTDKPDPKTGRYHSIRYVAHPWYIKPTLSARWGFEALRTRLWDGVLPGDEGSKFVPDGYLIPQIGPTALEGQGHEEMLETRTRLWERRAGMCPMSRF